MEQENQITRSPQILTALSWKAPEYENVSRSSDWFWSLWIISVAFSITAVIFKNVLLGILLLLVAFSITLFGHRKPRIIKFKIDQRGIYSEDTFYPYSTLESFWIDDVIGPRSKLILKSKKKLLSYIVIPIEDKTQDEARYIISAFLREEEHQESLFIKIIERLGF